MELLVSDVSQRIGNGSLGGPPLHRLSDRPMRLADDRFADVVRPILGRLVRVAKRILGDDDLAGDAVQEALVSLWLAGGLPPNPQAWLIRAVTHRSLHLARTRSRRRKNEAIASRDRSEVRLDDEPSRAIEREELRHHLAGTIAGLADEHRTVFELRAIEGMDYQSIARTLRIPIGTVRSRLNRSRTALQNVVLRG